MAHLRETQMAGRWVERMVILMAGRMDSDWARLLDWKLVHLSGNWGFQGKGSLVCCLQE